MNIVPKTNERLAEKILESGGILMSEYPLGAPVEKFNFVQRDRLQSALSDGIIVIETEERGGAMHAVGHAIEWGKPIAAYSHPCERVRGQTTRGNQKLIREGSAEPIDLSEKLDMFIEAVRETRSKSREAT
jgi:DNA processing protein